MSAGERYLDGVGRILEQIAADEWPSIRAAAGTVADTIAGDGLVHVFGTGHSHMLAEEMFYRAGGLVDVRPILFEGLMLHADAPMSTNLERLTGLAAVLLDGHGVASGDVLFVFSNSGRNAVTIELAEEAMSRGLSVIAITSRRHSESIAPRGSEHRLFEIADVVVDNGGEPGDAAIHVTGFDRAVAPTSTAVGAAIVNAIVAEAVALTVDAGVIPRVFASSNSDDGDAINALLLEQRR